MKLSYQKFCASPPASYKAILFSSFDDALLASPFIKQINRLFPGIEVMRVSAPNVLNANYNLLENLRSAHLFAPPPMIIVDDITPSHLPALKKLVDELLPSDRLLLTSGYLKASSALRAYFESTDQLFFTPIYTPNETQVQQTVRDLLSSFGHEASSELLAHLAQLYGKSTQLLESELIPFCLLFPKPCSITLPQYLSYAQTATFDDNAYIKSFLVRRFLPTDLPSFSSPIGFLRLLSFHVQRLLEHKGSQSRFPLKASLDMQPVYEKALALWSLDQLSDALKKLHTLELKYKTQNIQGTSDILYALFPIFGPNSS